MADLFPGPEHLSPAAQAVRDAFNRGWSPNLPAALRAAASEIENAHDGLGCLEMLRGIAAELEGHG